MSFTEKTALVTGASRGIGRGIATQLAARGAKVFCVSTREGGCEETLAQIREAGGEAEAMAVDVADETAVQGMADSVLAQGGLDILVNNAGITRDGVFLRMSSEDFDSVLAINLRGAFLTSRAFARPMMKARGGRIVNISSIVGLTGNAGQANYAASKAGLIGFSKSLAREIAGRGVTVNVVAPGFIATDMTATLAEDIREETLKNIPLGRFGAAEDIATAVAFLCSNSASYITGQVLVVDGGMTM